MKIIRYETAAGEQGYGQQHAAGAVTRLSGDLFGSLTDTQQPVQVAKLLAPLVPRDIICIGLNYRKHADELAVVLKKESYNVSKANALDYVLGYTCANDVSARDWQMKFGGSQWCRGKTFATFCPLGPCLTTADEIPNPNNLGIRTVLNGQTMQDWNTNDMIFDVPTLIEFLSGSTRLAAGTVILTGTPHGVGAARKPPVFLQPGDTVTIEIDGIGALTNPVIAEDE